MSVRLILSPFIKESKFVAPEGSPRSYICLSNTLPRHLRCDYLPWPFLDSVCHWESKGVHSLKHLLGGYIVLSGRIVGYCYVWTENNFPFLKQNGYPHLSKHLSKLLGNNFACVCRSLKCNYYCLPTEPKQKGWEIAEIYFLNFTGFLCCS